MKSVALTPLPEPVAVTLEVPGSKSYTNRALVLAAMTSRPVKILNPLVSDDTQAMLTCLQSLGVAIMSGDGYIEVSGGIKDIEERDYELNAQLSGTTMRFLLALCAILPGRQTLRGQKRLQERPVGELVSALKELGANISYLGEEGFLPVQINSSELKPGTVTLGGSQSSQHLSALLMVAPLVGDLTIEITGDLASRPFVDMTMDIMRKFGVEANNDSYHHFKIAGGQSYDCREYAVEGDVSSASYFFAIAALTSSTVTVSNVSGDSCQADMQFLDVLMKMGVEVAMNKRGVTVAGRSLRPISVDMRDCPDQAQTLAVLAAFADGETVIKGVKSLRIKETERVEAVQQELAKMGIKTSSTEDSLTVRGGRPQAAAIDTYGDHRMAMAFAVAGTKLPGMAVNDPDVVSKTFPDFWEKLRKIGVGIEERS